MEIFNFPFLSRPIAMRIGDLQCCPARANNCVKSFLEWSVDHAGFTSTLPFVRPTTRNKMKTAGRYMCAHGVQRLKSCQIASNYEPVDAYANENLSGLFGYLPLSWKKAPTEIFSLPPIPYNSVNHLILPRVSILVSRSFPHSLPWRIFRGNANSGSPTSSLKLAIYRIDDVEGKWMYVCGKIEATPWIYPERIFPYPRCPWVISTTTRRLILRDKENSSLIRWRTKTRYETSTAEQAREM